MDKRFRNYFNVLFKALLKYGYSNFKLEILEYCDPENLVDREQHYLNLLKPEYNVLKDAGSSLGFKLKNLRFFTSNF